MTQVRVDEKTWGRLLGDKESTLAAVLKDKIPASVHLSRDAKLDIKMAMLGYIMHVTSFNELKKRVRYWDLEVQDAYRLLHGILESYEANLGIKQTMLICMERDRKKEKVQPDKLLKMCELNPANEVLLANMRGIHFGRNLLSNIEEKPILMPHLVKRNCGNMMSELESHITRFVYRKLDFIVKSNRMKHEDMVAELTRKGIETYYRVTPIQGGAWRENKVKRSIHNQGMKFISFYTSKKRARLSNWEHVPTEESIFNLDGKINDTKYQDTEWETPTKRFEENRFMMQYIEKHPKQAHIVLKLLYKDNDVQFENYVRNKLRAKPEHSIEQITESKAAAYVRFIADYHEIPELTVRRIAYELLRAFNGIQTQQ